MQVDDSFIKGLKNAVRPEFLINDGIWKEWHDTLFPTDFFAQNIHEFARSRQMLWPSSMHQETFGYFLNLKFADVKNLLGNDSKRTLIFCLAEKMKSLNTEKLQSLTNGTHFTASTNIKETDNNDSPSVVLNDEFSVNLSASINDIVKDHIQHIAETSANDNKLSGLLDNFIKDVEEEKSILAARCEKTEKQLLEQKRLFAELTKLSQDQQIDIEVLRRENNLLHAEFEMFKEGYLALKAVYNKLLSENQDVLQNGCTMLESHTIKTEVSVPRKAAFNTATKKHSYKREQEKRETTTDEVSFSPFDFGDDIKI